LIGLPRQVVVGLAIVLALAVGLLLGRATTDQTPGGEQVSGVVQGLNGSKTAVAFTPDGGSGTSYRLAPDTQGVERLRPGNIVTLWVAELPDGSSIVYQVT